MAQSIKEIEEEDETEYQEVPNLQLKLNRASSIY